MAALGVVITHCLLASINFAHIYSHEWLLPLWFGDEGVTIFFVLSGFVLTLPYIAERFDAAAYYPSRFVRLYLPVWAALVVALILHKAQGWSPISGANFWLNLHSFPLTVHEAARDAVLFRAGGFAYFSAIWSLKWEVIFSTILPLAIWFGARTKRIAPVVVMGLLVVIAAGTGYAGGYFQYLPVFGLGVALAFGSSAMRSWWRHTGSRVAQDAIVTACLVLLLSDWWLGPSHPEGITPMLVSAGAGIVVMLAFCSEQAQRVLDSRVIHWLGVRSFSLYLIHEPIVITLAFVLHISPAPFLLIALPSALIGAELFYRAFEHPAHRLSRWLRARTRGTVPALEVGLS